MNKPTIKTADDIKQLGTILSVWAHPDDETFTSAGIIATAVANGQRVACVTATKGEAGSQDLKKWPLETLGEVRTKELHHALDILGCKRHNMLDYPDGGCANVSNDLAIAKIKGLIVLYKPDTILTFGPEGITGHTDHIAVGNWARAAVKELNLSIAIYHPVEINWVYERYMKKADELLNIFFNIDEPPLKDPEECDIYFELTPEVKTKKHHALAAMPSQTEGFLINFSQAELDEMFSVEAFVRYH